MKKAWETARELFLQADPVIRSAGEQTWEDRCSSIPAKYLHPAFDRLTTYMRGEMREITMDALEEKTVQAVAEALKTQ